MSELWEAVDSLTNGTPHRVVRDDRTVEHVRVASLWEQLVECVTQGSEGGGGRSAPGSRPPVAIDAMSAKHRIEGHVQSYAIAWDLRRTYDVPTDVRHLASELVRTGDRGVVAQLTADVRRWASLARAVVGESRTRPDLPLRGKRCVACGAHVHRVLNAEGEPTLRPVLVVSFTEDGLVRAATCDACGAIYWPGDDFLRLEAQQ